MCLLLPSITKLLKEALSLNKTELNVLWLLWSLKSTNYRAMINQRTNPGEENLFVDRKNIAKGISVKELQKLLNLTQPAVQQALKSLLKRGYVKREKVNKGYRYLPEVEAYREFKVQLERYQTGFKELIDPILQSPSPERALKKIKDGVQEQWNVQGWQELAGLENFLIRKDKAAGKISTRELDLIKNDVTGNSLTSGVSQIFTHDTLILKTDSPYTSPFHMESNAISGLWSIVNNTNGKKENQRDTSSINFVTGSNS